MGLAKAAHYSFLTAHKTTLKKAIKSCSPPKKPIRVHYTKAINMALILPSSGLRFVHTHAKKIKGKLFNIM
jgi:hypothetical protein